MYAGTVFIFVVSLRVYVYVVGLVLCVVDECLRGWIELLLLDLFK